MDDDVSPSFVIGLIFAILGTVAVIGIALWGFGVFSSGVKGKGDVIKKNNSADNQIQAQDAFNKLWGEIQGYHADIISSDTQVADDDAKGKDDTYDRSVLNAEKATCRTAVGQYNAYTIDTTMKEWRPSQDPASIDITTECEAR